MKEKIAQIVAFFALSFICIITGSQVMKLQEEEKSDLISLNLPSNFIKDFIQYWENIKRTVRPDGKTNVSWKKWNEISQKALETLTMPFFNKWKHLGIFSWIEAYIDSFFSITLNFKGGAILLPKQLILYEAMKPSNSLLSNLKEEPSSEGLERILDSLFGDLDIRLIMSDLQILKKLAQPKFSKSLDRFPKLKELAYGIRRDVRTVSNRLDYLIQTRILCLIYLVDMARIGYQTILLRHSIKRSQILKEIHPYIVMDFPLSSDSFLTIIHFPFRDVQVYKNLITFFNPNEMNIMNKQYRGWNFSGLTKDPNKRWRLLPPILQDGGNWKKELITAESGIEFNLDPYYDPFPLSYRQGQLLGLIHKLSTMEEEYLAKQLKVGRAYVSKDAKTLLRNRVIFRFPIFFNLGFGTWIYFCIRNLISNKSGGLLNVLEHLKFFPYVNVYYNLDEGALIGRTRIPPSWTDRFIFSLSSLPSVFPEASISYYIGPKSYAPWGFDILGTFDWDNYPK
ncbi:MAG: hypothetical protein JSW11_07980 [Candidatus Heimdallarchaeota archaeon]|nr:MAG: hypothetical protein JSW11_07980 [Candidatus Heimdallarchaeota archaeon]